MELSPESPDFVTALARGIDILLVFSREKPELTLSEVSALANVAPATARRSLLTLQALGYVRSYGRRFVLTPRVLRLSASFLSSMNLQEVANQYLQDVVNQTGDSSSVAVLDGGEIVYIASVPSKRSVRLTAGLGTRYPAYATSLGRAILAYLPPDALDRYLAETKLNKLTEKTVTEPEQLREILAEIRASGVASIQDELDYGVVSVSVPVFAENGAVVAAVNCSTSPARISREEMLASRLPLLQVTARQISETLRHNPALVHSVLGY